ncbi:MAG: pyridoxamine 5'-phosphate oxidase family protein [Desulfosudaceae bacterium]
MRPDIQKLIAHRRHCVLATAVDNRPYCSLMAYTASDDGTCIFLVTHRHTRKFKNLLANPSVSLLIDSRETDAPQALTIVGTAEEMPPGKEKNAVQERLLTVHPDLRELAAHPGAAVIRVRVRQVIFLNGLTDAYHETMAP